MEQNGIDQHWERLVYISAGDKTRSEAHVRHCIYMYTGINKHKKYCQELAIATQ